jgi:hypothetical protein
MPLSQLLFPFRFRRAVSLIRPLSFESDSGRPSITRQLALPVTKLLIFQLEQPTEGVRPNARGTGQTNPRPKRSG